MSHCLGFGASPSMCACVCVCLSLSLCFRGRCTITLSGQHCWLDLRAVRKRCRVVWAVHPLSMVGLSATDSLFFTTEICTFCSWIALWRLIYWDLLEICHLSVCVSLPSPRGNFQIGPGGWTALNSDSNFTDNCWEFRGALCTMENKDLE
jgi:hypothetical protein